MLAGSRRMDNFVGVVETSERTRPWLDLNALSHTVGWVPKTPPTLRSPESLLLREHQPPQARQRVIVFIDHAFLERDDGVVGDGDVLGADLRAALGDVAQADAVVILQIF